MPQLVRRTVLQIVQAVADRVGFPRPTRLNDDVNLNERRFRQAIQNSVRDIARYQPPSLIREHTFYTRSSQETYQLPNDFGGFVHNTFWNKTQADPVELVPAVVWQQNKSGIAASAFTKRYRVKAFDQILGRIFLDPVPTTAEQFVFEYISNAYFLSESLAGNNAKFYISNSTAGSEVQIACVTTSVVFSADVLIISDYFNQSGGVDMNGMTFSISSTTTSAANGRGKAWLMGTDGADFADSASGVFREVLAFLDGSVTAKLENAVPVIDSELLEQGSVWRMRHLIGQPFAEDKIAFEEHCQQYMGTHRDASILSLSGGRRVLSTGNIPDGNFTQ